MEENLKETVPAGTPTPLPRLKIAGVGGAAGRVLARICAEKKYTAPQFFALDTDAADLKKAAEEAGGEGVFKTVLLGEGVAAGMDAERGAVAAKNAAERLREIFADTDVLVIVAALGRGTGSGASVELAKIAQSLGVCVVAFSTMPFSWEGTAPTETAYSAVEALQANSNAFVLIENNLVSRDGLAADDPAYCNRVSDHWIRACVASCCEILLCETGAIHRDFATFGSLFPAAGTRTLFAFGAGVGESAQETALTELARCPLLKATTSATRSVEKLIVHIRAGTEPSPAFITETVQRVKERFGGNEVTLGGFCVDPQFDDNRVEICALGSTTREVVLPVAPKKPAPSAAEPVPDAEENPILILSPYGNAPEKKKKTAFEKTSSAFGTNHMRLYNGIDLEAPTYRRKAVDLEKVYREAKRNSGN